MANTRAIEDRGARGLEVPRRLSLAGGVDPTRSIYLFEDFITDHIAEDSNVVVNQSGTPTTAAAILATAGAPTAGHGGWIAGSVDNVDDEIDEVALGAKPWLVPAAVGTGLVVAEIGFVIPTALTARGYFVGLGDAETGGADDDGMLSISTGITLVSGATGDAAGFVMSSLATDADGWYTGAVKATAVGTALNVTTSSEGPSNVGPAVVDDYTKLRVEVDVNGSCYFYGIVSGAGQRSVVPTFCDFQNAAITAAAVLEPIFSARSTTTTAVEWEIDYMYGGVAA